MFSAVYFTITVALSSGYNDDWNVCVQVDEDTSVAPTANEETGSFQFAAASDVPQEGFTF